MKTDFLIKMKLMRAAIQPIPQALPPTASAAENHGLAPLGWALFRHTSRAVNSRTVRTISQRIGKRLRDLSLLKFLVDVDSSRRQRSLRGGELQRNQMIPRALAAPVDCRVFAGIERRQTPAPNAPPPPRSLRPPGGTARSGPSRWLAKRALFILTRSKPDRCVGVKNSGLPWPAPAGRRRGWSAAWPAAPGI